MLRTTDLKNKSCKHLLRTFRLCLHTTKYKEMILDAAETVLGLFGFDRTVYSNLKKGRRKWRWYEELRERRVRDIEAEMI